MLCCTLQTLEGDFHYMCPELRDGHRASAASDTYAFGVVMCELLTGQSVHDNNRDPPGIVHLVRECCSDAQVSHSVTKTTSNAATINSLTLLVTSLLQL
jgi:serine/threonine protein kinase